MSPRVRKLVPWILPVVVGAIFFFTYIGLRYLTVSNDEKLAQETALVKVRADALAKETRLKAAVLAQATLFNCREIEGLKKAVRDDAIREFKQAPIQIQALNIVPTKPYLAEIKRNRDGKLVRFRPNSCPRPTPPKNKLGG